MHGAHGTNAGLFFLILAKESYINPILFLYSPGVSLVTFLKIFEKCGTLSKPVFSAISKKEKSVVAIRYCARSIRFSWRYAKGRCPVCLTNKREK